MKIRLPLVYLLFTLIPAHAQDRTQLPVLTPAHQIPAAHVPTTPLPTAPAPAAPAARPASKAHFADEAAAQRACGSEIVVWASLSSSHAFHLPGSRYYGATKKGTYMCRAAAEAAGFHQAGGHG